MRVLSSGWRPPTMLLSQGLGWPAGLVAAIVGWALLVLWLPPGGPRVEVRWKLEVAEEARRSIEQQFDLINPMFLGQTRWGYIFDNRSPDGLLRLTQAFGVDKLTFIDGNPPALTGPTIVRMAGPFAVQSFVSLGLGLLIIFGSYAPAANWRRAYLLLACGLLSSSWYLCQLPISSSNEIHFWMGDFGTYTDSRAAFDTYFSMENSVRFHFHLSRPILYWLDRALGSTATSPQQALLVLSWLAGCAFIAGVMVVARIERWSAHALRYVGLAVASPTTLFYFGFRELGYLPLSVLAFPLLIRASGSLALPTRVGFFAASGVEHGLRSALHGFGLVGLAGAVAGAAVQSAPLRAKLIDVGTVVTSGLAAYLAWIPIYLIVLGRDIVPGHATGIPLRRLFQGYVAEGRMVLPLLSAQGISELSYEALVVGVPLVAVGLLLARSSSSERRISVAYALVSVTALALVWPAQGAALDIDSVLALFPAVFAGAWLCARGPLTAAAGYATAVLAHVVFWHLVRHYEFAHPPL